MVDYREGVYLPSNEQLMSSCHPKCVNCNQPVIIVNHGESVYLSFNEHILDKEYVNCTSVSSETPVQLISVCLEMKEYMKCTQ